MAVLTKPRMGSLKDVITARRWLYCDFVKDAGMKLKVYVGERQLSNTLLTHVCFHRPQLTIATAIVFCHRFFEMESHAGDFDTSVRRHALYIKPAASLVLS